MRRFLLASALLAMPSALHAWVPPTPEELHMKAPVEDPGAHAVYLSWDELDSDELNDHNITVRLKVLTPEGVKRYADVEIGTPERRFAIEAVEARTIHEDGTVIPFTGKPFVKTLRRRGEGYKATVFSMPDVQPGSILEYHYRIAYDDRLLIPAHWYVQQEAYVLHAHYVFRPFKPTGSHFVTTDHGQISRGLFYISNLPKDAAIAPDNGSGHAYYELTVNKVPGLPDEEALPPIRSFSYRMLFYYAAQLNQNEYWATEGKFMSHDMNAFATAGPKLKAEVAALTAPTDTPEVKARKLYAAVMKLENTDYTRSRSRGEETAEGLRPVKTAEDVWVRARGTGEELALVYLAILRTAGLQAYGMRVTNRDRNLFVPEYIDVSQLDDTVVIANLNGKEVYLDPGARFCPFGQLAWRHSFAAGVRQTEKGTAIADAGPLDYRDSAVKRIAVLGIKDDGTGAGTLTLSYTGQEAMLLRQRETGEDAADTKQRFEDQARRMLPGGMNLHVISIKNLDDGEKPLEIVFGVNGAIATASGHRLLLSESLLRGNAEERFTAPTRKNGVYFHYPYAETDVVQLQLPNSLKLEAVPADQKGSAMGVLAYTLQVKNTGNIVQMTRTMAEGAVLVPATDYSKLREFFGSLRAADENQLLLQRTEGTTSAAAH